MRWTTCAIWNRWPPACELDWQKLGRDAWMDAEMSDLAARTSRPLAPSERWWKVSAFLRLVAAQPGRRARDLAVARSAKPSAAIAPTRRVLRDDLIVELAKRRSTDQGHIRSLRGMERGDLARCLPQLAAAVGRAMALSEEECPATPPREAPSQLNVLGQFLSSALASICRSADVAPSMVGTASDVRELVAFRLGMQSGGRQEPPLLAQGWRAEVVGRLIDDLLSGKLAVRISDPRSDDPLSFERIT